MSIEKYKKLEKFIYISPLFCYTDGEGVSAYVKRGPHLYRK